MPASLFISYSRADTKWLDKLEKQLEPLERKGLIEMWDDRQLRADDSRTWESILLPKLHQADILVLLLSPDFNTSPYCQEIELPVALEKKRSGQALVFLVYVRPFILDEQMKQFQILPNVRFSVSEAPNEDRALMDVAAAIEKALSERGPAARPTAAAITGAPRVDKAVAYLCNRMDQEDELEIFIEDTKARAARPLVFLLGGARRECHEAFHERLGRSFLPRQLGVAATAPRLVDLPAGTPGATAAKLLAKRVERAMDPAADFYFLTAILDLGGGDTGQLAWAEALLEHWNTAPDAAVALAVSITWETSGPGRAELQARFLGEKYPNLRFIVLPELLPPERTHALKWLQLPQVQPYVRPDSVERVDGLFPPGQTNMPMKELAEKLITTLGG